MNYSPKQIISFKDFPNVNYTKISYQGFYQDDIEYLWILESDQEVQNFKYLIIPDGCIDIISDIENPDKLNIFVSRPFDKAIYVDFPNTFKYWGVRIKPRRALRFLDFFPSEIKDDFKDIVLESEEIARLKKYSKNIQEYCEVLLNVLFNKAKSEIIKRILRELELNPDLSNISPRHARRLFKLITGFSRKSFEKTIKINRNISNSKDFYRDYFDQSHFIKTFKTATGLTPKQFFKRYKL